MEQTWFDQYESPIMDGMHREKYSSLIDVFQTSINKHASNTAFINLNHRLTFDDVDLLSRNFASYLQSIGLRKGDTIALMLPNIMQYPIAMFGSLLAGLTVVNVNPLCTAQQLKYQLIDANVSTIVIAENCAFNLSDIINETSIRNTITTQMGDLLPSPRRFVVNFSVKRIQKKVPFFDLPSSVSFIDALSIGEASDFVQPHVTGDDLAFLQYTGGTTGDCKGAMLSHRNMVANLEQIGETVEPFITPVKDLIVTALPLYHIFAVTSNFFMFFSFGCPNLLVLNPYNVKSLARELQKHNFAVLTGVNNVFSGLLNTPAFAEVDFDHLKFSLCCGTAVPRPVAEHWRQLTGKTLVEGYGLTECSPVVCVNPIASKNDKGSIGLPLPDTEIKITDSNGKFVDIGEPGELHVKGPQVMRGYFGKEQATKDILSNGWLATGDIATYDEEGYIYLVDRKKDMILVSGFIVFPSEIEEVASMHEGVKDVAAIGVPHQVSGEVVKLFVVKRDQNLTKEEIIDHCQSLLTGYKVPKLIDFVHDLPKSNVGKTLRRELRKSEAS